MAKRKDKNAEENCFVDKSVYTDLYNILNDEVKQSIVREIPLEKRLNVNQNPLEVESKINQENGSMMKIIADAFKNNENLRLKRQTPLFWVITIFLGFQLLAFNLLMFYLTYHSFNAPYIMSYEVFMDFLKYYVGAVLVELIGLVSVIVCNTFSSNPVKMLEKLLDSK